MQTKAYGIREEFVTASACFTTTFTICKLTGVWVKSYKNYKILTIIANFVIYASEQNHDVGEHSEQGDDVWEHLSGLTGKGETLSEL